MGRLVGPLHFPLRESLVPKLMESVMVEAAKTRFRAFNITLPTVVVTGKPPNVAQYLVQNKTMAAVGGAPKQIAVGGVSSSFGSIRPGGIPAPVRPTATPQSFPPALFRSASNDKADVDFQTEATNEFSNYIAGICRAIVVSHDNWRSAAHLQGVTINAAMASGGSINGPSLAPNIFGNGPQQGLWGVASAYTRAIADGFATCWSDWQKSVSVPNMMWYPAFVVFPLAVAPPLPNIPCPLGLLKWAASPLLPGTLATTVSRKFTPQAGPYSEELFQSVAAGLAAALPMWFAGQMVMFVLGKGPVPSYAPPYVPVGPVVGGSIIEAPPHFAS